MEIARKQGDISHRRRHVLLSSPPPHMSFWRGRERAVLIVFLIWRRRAHPCVSHDSELRDVGCLHPLGRDRHRRGRRRGGGQPDALLCGRGGTDARRHPPGRFSSSVPGQLHLLKGYLQAGEQEYPGEAPLFLHRLNHHGHPAES